MNDVGMPPAIEAFQVQITACRAGGSPFSASVLEILATDFAKQGPVHGIARNWDKNAVKDAMALRLLGGLHHLVLDGSASELACHFPSAGGTPSPSLAADVIQTTHDHFDFLVRYMELPPQTNEVGRSHALLGGFLTLVKEFRMPLRLLEIGSSAGLNLFWDTFFYENASFQWGNQDSAVILETNWSGSAPTDTNAPEIIERAGCDIAPMDVNDDAACLRLESYVWADQGRRLDRLRGAIEIAKEKPFRLEQADASAWLNQELQHQQSGACTVVFHSIMWQYMTGEDQADTEKAIRCAGLNATNESPVAWLRLELDEPTQFPVIRLTTWPHGEERLLGTAHFHGAWVRWGESTPGHWA